jgi:hypothetical protein
MCGKVRDKRREKRGTPGDQAEEALNSLAAPPVTLLNVAVWSGAQFRHLPKDGDSWPNNEIFLTTKTRAEEVVR